MKIEGFQINQENNIPEVYITKKDNKFIISAPSVLNKGEYIDFIVDETIFDAKKKKTVFFNSIDEWIVIDDEDMNRSKDLASFLEYQKMVRPLRAYFNIVWGNTYDESMIFFIRNTKTDLKDFVSHNKGFWLHDYFAEQYPDNTAYLRDNVKAKHNLLLKINAIDSVTAVEQQLDLLTEIVSCIVNNQEQPSWSNDFLNKSLLKSSQSLRDVNKIQNDVLSYKENLRNKIKEYLSKKS